MRLRPQEVRIHAPRELVFEVVASAGTQVGEEGDARIVEFETSWRGRVYRSTEEVMLEPPHRIAYRWMVGPLDGVEEEILLSEMGEGSTRMSYRGSFRPPPGLTGWIRAVTVVRPIFNKLVRGHLEQGKKLSESRASRSRIYPR